MMGTNPANTRTHKNTNDINAHIAWHHPMFSKREQLVLGLLSACARVVYRCWDDFSLKFQLSFTSPILSTKVVKKSSKTKSPRIVVPGPFPWHYITLYDIENKLNFIVLATTLQCRHGFTPAAAFKNITRAQDWAITVGHHPTTIWLSYCRMPSVNQGLQS